MPRPQERQDILFATTVVSQSSHNFDNDILDSDLDDDLGLEVTLMQADYRQQMESAEW